MTMNKENFDNRKLTGQLLKIALLMAIGMTAYEIFKQVVAPDITIWQSHVITIVFSTVSATVASFFIIRKQIEMNGILNEKVTESERFQRELERSVDSLREALAEVNTLSGLLPICASCKKIRDDKGYWRQIESYIRDHSEVDFSHSICPDCEKQYYPEFFREKDA